jgi:DNA-binding NarL/FixJ family response regulator
MAMYSVALISRDPAARELWARELAAHRCDAIVSAPGPAAVAVVVAPLDAVVVEIEYAADWLHFDEIAQADRTAPLIVLSFWHTGDGRYRKLAFRMGCDAYLQAPCTAQHLLETIDRLADGERRIDAESRAGRVVPWRRSCPSMTKGEG